SAVTCHHCEDAPCARSCPNGAIAHINDSVQVNAQKCIGCKSCGVGQHEGLYNAYRDLRDGDHYATLNTAQKKAVDNALRDFELSG
ncbi:hypothetical protein MJN76_31750, partial [Salmonella enterica subsp. enterica serovar Anatum]|nr:hypothetical protein [Salmonella enterica subsp. enterica serovar Anatum]